MILDSMTLMSLINLVSIKCIYYVLVTVELRPVATAQYIVNHLPEHNLY